MKAEPVVFNKAQRSAVQEAIEEVCKYRSFGLYALNVRTNHGHAVVAAQIKPEIIANTFKAYSTRRLRDDGLLDASVSPWSRGRSRRYLWKSNHVDAAVDYVLYCQGTLEFEDWYSTKFVD